MTHTASVPVWLFVALGVLLFWGMTYLDKNAGGFNPHVYGLFGSSNAVAKAQPAGDPLIALGRDVYNKPTCVSCHQPNGQGTPGVFPTLVGAEWVLEPNPARLIRIVLDGLQGPIEVKGQMYNNVMVRWKDVLSDEEVAAVLTYVRKEWGNDAPSVSVEQVAKIRAEDAGRNNPWTSEELLKIPVPAE